MCLRTALAGRPREPREANALALLCYCHAHKGGFSRRVRARQYHSIDAPLHNRRVRDWSTRCRHGQRSAQTPCRPTLGHSDTCARSNPGRPSSPGRRCIDCTYTYSHKFIQHSMSHTNTPLKREREPTLQLHTVRDPSTSLHTKHQRHRLTPRSQEARATRIPTRAAPPVTFQSQSDALECAVGSTWSPLSSSFAVQGDRAAVAHSVTRGRCARQEHLELVGASAVLCAAKANPRVARDACLKIARDWSQDSTFKKI